jgi:putative transposase
MPYNPEFHHRHSMRLKGYDYSQAGAYFVTLVALERACLFGEIDGEEIHLNLAGQCAAAVWKALGNHFGITIDEFVIMPNHMHGILVFRGEESPGPTTGRKIQPDHPNPSSLPNGTHPGSLNAVIQNYKSVVTRRIHALPDLCGAPVWQRNYYEQIIRNNTDLNRIRQYIRDNPHNWAEDNEHPG